MRDEILPQVQQQKGFRGISVSGDRSAEVMMVLTQWDSAADLEASESMADKARSDAVRVAGGEPHVDRFEQLIWETGATRPGPGTRLHVRPIKMDPSQIDENLAFFKETVLPEIKGGPGFVGIRLLINRTTGEGRAGTLWVDQASVEKAAEMSEQRRARAAERGVEFGEASIYEILFVAT
jgi:heme-degrading monooxygenase HmoA